MIAGVETGGTKVVCGVARREAPQRILRTERFPTTTPAETIGRINAFLEEAAVTEPIEALGVATFGPAERLDAPDFVVPAALGDQSGLSGAIAAAADRLPLG
jgi:fructokinase